MDVVRDTPARTLCAACSCSSLHATSQEIAAHVQTTVLTQNMLAHDCFWDLCTMFLYDTRALVDATVAKPIVALWPSRHPCIHRHIETPAFKHNSSFSMLFSWLLVSLYLSLSSLQVFGQSTTAAHNFTLAACPARATQKFDTCRAAVQCCAAGDSATCTRKVRVGL